MEEYKYAEIDAPPMRRLVAEDKRLQISQNFVPIFRKQFLMIDAVELRDEHGRHGDAAKEGVGLVVEFGPHAERVFAAYVGGRGGISLKTLPSSMSLTG